ncbi:MAG TPA: hypothetical protein VHR66_09495 [Gemmataceae bacterium]|jgi:hypothetical protein|nr:hypothetical protein [Gemmataceae bacterium]
MWRLAFTALIAIGVAGAEPLRPREGTLAVGDTAPSFQLKDLATGKDVALIETGKTPTVLIFGSCT